MSTTPNNEFSTQVDTAHGTGSNHVENNTIQSPGESQPDDRQVDGLDGLQDDDSDTTQDSRFESDYMKCKRLFLECKTSEAIELCLKNDCFVV